MQDYSFFKCNFIQQNHLWRIVENFRSEHCQGESIPLNVEYIIERKLGIEIIPELRIADSDIEAYLKSDYTAIVVDQNHYMNEQGKYDRSLRFSFAHEVGHLILHKYIYDVFSLEVQDENAHLNFLLYAPEDEYSKFEWQANEFAGRLLVPIDRFITEITGLFKELKKNKLEHLWRTSPGMVLSGFIPRLNKIFGVSDYIIQRRIQEEKIEAIIDDIIK